MLEPLRNLREEYSKTRSQMQAIRNAFEVHRRIAHRDVNVSESLPPPLTGRSYTDPIWDHERPGMEKTHEFRHHGPTAGSAHNSDEAADQ